MNAIPILAGSILALLCSCQDSDRRDDFETKTSSEIETLNKQVENLNDQVSQLSNELKKADSSLKQVEANSSPSDKLLSILQQFSKENKDLSETLRGLASRQMLSEEAVQKLAENIRQMDQKLSNALFAKDTQNAAQAEQRNQQINLIRQQIKKLQIRERELSAKLANIPSLEYRIGNSIGATEKNLEKDMEWRERLYGPLRREYGDIQNQIAQQTSLLNDLLIQP